MNEIASMLNLKPMGILRKTITTNGWKVISGTIIIGGIGPGAPPNQVLYNATLMDFNIQSDELQDLRAGRRTFAQRIHGKATHCLVCEARK